ncbi:hypothetical protein BDA96_10G009200 [Sorghum bicolor]|uniref:TF-B3 domain-containing protein n=2 Tax=Sorghum bicolor TaxID=4558 RepID=C5Z2Q1_SORBI|nr:B3 domain-containing protein Os06g0112300 isoform X2 [Sorghum bicolor]EER89060.1 hypothetical protein SORBI_3010G008300 [Sorghum bicolor]KAG0512388.1 hypothetical protein BDA96_10G009200 [Sorghum bicolor]OQU75694.1 hypothetical protein SORBI_3010G008300 [Sorghum bicolor]|eukprot:XP_002437693.1 B3 domain-containing protein Os06g0112300 isoform X2 [Sorghum bicolor]
MEIPGCVSSINPKVEPCEDEEPPLPPPFQASSDEWEVTPLSGDNPFFTSVMCKSQVQNPFQLVIPVRFHRHLPETRAPAVLMCRGRSWTVSYCGVGKWKRLQGAWRDFARDNGLRLGDACVFELVVPTAAGAGTEAAAAAASERDGNDSSGSSKEKEGKTMEVVFRVQVLRSGLPEEIASRGATSDDPLVILD